jgi:hypothetical protein
MQLTVQVVDGELRVQDLMLAERLGFAETRAIRKLIERNIERLSRRGEVCVTASQTSDLGGRPGREYWLTKWQAIKICMWSEAPNVDAVQDEIADVFEAYTDGKLIHRDQSPVTTQNFEQMFRETHETHKNVLRLVSSNERIESSSARIERRMGDVIPRYDPSSKNQRIYLHTVKTRFDGLCPCGCRQKLLDDNGELLLR